MRASMPGSKKGDGRSGRFKPGDPRINRKGRPKLGTSLAEQIRDALQEQLNEETGYNNLHLLIDIAIRRAKAGNTRMLDWLTDHGYGKAPERVEFSQQQPFDASKLSDA